MNAISQLLEVEVEKHQVEDVVLALFHTILLHRSSGKFHYQADDSYHIKELAFEDVTCTNLQLTYVRCQSRELDQSLRCQVAGFVNKMAQAVVPTSGKVALEFYEKKKKSWLFPNDSSVAWEVWNVRLGVTQPSSERWQFREMLGSKVRERIWDILQSVHRHDYAPPNPTHLDLASVYETEYSDVQPYLFKVNMTLSPPSGKLLSGPWADDQLVSYQYSHQAAA
ncbi:Autophagy-related protein 101 [Trinorchestia longiramus]|nr:Autophagy-related protein 101 [Trinorchestia longiramus]